MPHIPSKRLARSMAPALAPRAQRRHPSFLSLVETKLRGGPPAADREMERPFFERIGQTSLPSARGALPKKTTIRPEGSINPMPTPKSRTPPPRRSSTSVAIPYRRRPCKKLPAGQAQRATAGSTIPSPAVPKRNGDPRSRSRIGRHARGPQLFSVIE